MRAQGKTMKDASEQLNRMRGELVLSRAEMQGKVNEAIGKAKAEAEAEKTRILEQVKAGAEKERISALNWARAAAKGEMLATIEKAKRDTVEKFKEEELLRIIEAERQHAEEGAERTNNAASMIDLRSAFLHYFPDVEMKIHRVDLHFSDVFAYPEPISGCRYPPTPEEAEGYYGSDPDASSDSEEEEESDTEGEKTKAGGDAGASTSAPTQAEADPEPEDRETTPDYSATPSPVRAPQDLVDQPTTLLSIKR